MSEPIKPNRTLDEWQRINFEDRERERLGVTEPIKPHDAGACEQTMTPAVQAVIDAADKRERDKAAMPADCTTPTGCRENGCHGACLPAVTKPIKLPHIPSKLAVALVGDRRWQELIADVDAYARLAVEQNTAELRAEVERLRAELARLTTLRPASEHDGESWAIWYDMAVNGVPVAIALAANNSLMQCAGWTPLPDVKEPTPC